MLFLVAAFIFIELPGIKDIPDATAGEQQLEIKVTGRQFYWQYEYPNGVIAIDQMRAPAGIPVKLVVSAPDSDVIHSWWIPALGGKIDAIPGRTNETWFEADKEGVYTGQCAELCGLEHARMLASVEVDAAVGVRRVARARHDGRRSGGARHGGMGRARAPSATGSRARAASARASPARRPSPIPRPSRPSSGTAAVQCPPSAPAGRTSRWTHWPPT